MSVRVAGPVRFEVENLEERRLLSGVGDAVAWDLKTPVSGEISQAGEVDYLRFSASAGEKIVFDSTGMKQLTILDSDGTSELDHLFIYDYETRETPGRLVFEAPHAGTFYVSVARYTAFLIDSQTGPYSLSAYQADASARPEDGANLAAGQTIHGDLSGAGDIDYYTFDAKAGTIYRFEITSENLSAGSSTAHYVMGVIEAQPWNPMPTQPQDAQEAFPGHNTRFATLDDQKALGLYAEWVAPASGTYHFSIAPLDAAHTGPYTLVMTQRASACDPQPDLSASDWILTATTQQLLSGKDSDGAASKNTQPTTSSPVGRHRKPRLHHRRPAVHKHATPSAKVQSANARQKLLMLARD